jgi:hypothetical protein
MYLDEARLKTHQVTRERPGAVGASGLTISNPPLVFDVLMDVQQSSTPRFVVNPGEERFTGAYRGFTYDETLRVGDRLYSTPFGALRIEAIYTWDDEEGEPTHYEIGLVPA